MGHDKLRKFAENETFSCLLQPSAQELLADGYFHLRDHAVKGHWSEFFSDCAAIPAVAPGNRATLGTVRGGTASEAQRWGPAQPDVSRGELPDCKQEKNDCKDIVLELGCGKGEYTIALAERDAERNYIGVDIKGARLWKGAKYATEHALPNVAFLRTRVEFITAFFAPGEVSEVWLTFSDPQFRSENSRLSSPLFLERYRSFMKPGGIVHLKTDSRFLYEYTRTLCEVNGLRILAQTTDLYNQPAEGVKPIVREVQTFYEKLFLQQGYPITYLSFVIDHDGPYVSPVEAGAFDTDYWRSVEGPRLLFGHDSAETRRQKMKKA